MVTLDLIISALINFFIVLVPFFIISFFIYKFFSIIRKKLVDKYDLSWTKSCLLVNFVSIFIFLLIVFVYFYFLGGVLAKPIDPEVQYNLIDDIIIILFASVRIIVASLIATFVLFFFEIFASFFMDSQIKKGKSKLFSEFFGITIACALALVLVLFIFNWVLLGFFIYVFYGSINPIPVLFIQGF